MANVKKLERAVCNFIKKNPNPSDDKLHRWADKKKYNIHKVEAQMYKLATKYVKGKK